MDAETTLIYLKAIEMIEAQQMLKQLTVADFPNMKKEEREKLHRKLHKKGFPDTYAITITPDQLAQMIKEGKL